jgi:hypothetical protein
MKYHQRYQLLKDLPTGHKKGQELCLNVSNETEPKMKWYFVFWDKMFEKWGYDIDYKGLSFDLEQIQNKEFFKPIGKASDLILPFPTKEKISEFFYLIGESRLVASVPEVRLISPIFYSDEFYNSVFEILKKMYDDKYGLS